MRIKYVYIQSEWEEIPFTYEVDAEDLKKAIIIIFAENYEIDEKKAKQIIDDFEIFDNLCKFFNYQIQEFFEEEAMIYYKENKNDL